MKQDPRGEPQDDGSAGNAPGLERPELLRVLESAARLQEVVPDAVLVGGSAAALWASHRSSDDHDHVLADLDARFDAGVATHLARQLADPRRREARTIQQLDQYKRLDARWTDWKNVTGVCRSVAVEMVK